MGVPGDRARRCGCNPNHLVWCATCLGQGTHTGVQVGCTPGRETAWTHANLCRCCCNPPWPPQGGAVKVRATRSANARAPRKSHPQPPRTSNNPSKNQSTQGRGRALLLAATPNKRTPHVATCACVHRHTQYFLGPTQSCKRIAPYPKTPHKLCATTPVPHWAVVPPCPLCPAAPSLYHPTRFCITTRCVCVWALFALHQA